MTDSRLARQTAERLIGSRAQLLKFSCLLGFDGFIDSILQVVDQRQTATKYLPYTSVKPFAKKLGEAAGKSANFEVVPTMEKIGHRVGLDAVASATCGIKKTASGLESIQWWREGKHQQVAEYCCYDVKATRMVHEHGVRTGQVAYMSFKTKLKQFAKVDWAAIGPVGHLLEKPATVAA